MRDSGILEKLEQRAFLFSLVAVSAVFALLIQQIGRAHV